MTSMAFLGHLLCGVLPRKQACSYGNSKLLWAHGAHEAAAGLTLLISLFFAVVLNPLGTLVGFTES